MCLSRPSLEIFYYLLQNRQIHCGEVRFVVDTHQIHLALHLSGDDGIGDDSRPPDLPRPFEAIAILIFRMPGLSSTSLERIFLKRNDKILQIVLERPVPFLQDFRIAFKFGCCGYL